MAASVNSSCAPRGPRSLSRFSLKIRFRCANNISTRLRSRRDCSKASVLESARAMSRASSLMSSGIMRAGVFGQHLDLRGHAPQSRVLAIYRSIFSERMRPVDAHRADVDIAFLGKREVSPRKGAVLTDRLVDNRDVRRDLLLID